MIFDTLNHLAQYKGICEGLDKLIDFTLSHDLNALPAGRNEIDGDLAWMNVNVATLVPDSDIFERHMEHLDLQIPLDEGEIITVCPVEELSWSFEGETGFTCGPAGTILHMVPGTFAVFFPGDAHNCGISQYGQTSCRKLVGKAKL